MHIDPFIVLGSAIVGLLVGMTGAGGGALMTPMLILLFGVQPGAAREPRTDYATWGGMISFNAGTNWNFGAGDTVGRPSGIGCDLAAVARAAAGIHGNLLQVTVEKLRDAAIGEGIRDKRARAADERQKGRHPDECSVAQ